MVTMRSIVIGVVFAACSRAAPVCPPAPVSPPIPTSTDATADLLARGCAISAIVISDAIKTDQLLAYDIARQSKLGDALSDPKRLTAAIENTLKASVAGANPALWVVAEAGRAIASSRPIASELLTDPMIGEALTHTRAVWKVDGQPVLVVGVPVVGPKSRAMLLIGRALDSTVITNLQQSARATITLADQAPAGVDPTCQPMGNVAAFSVASAVFVLTDPTR